MAQYDLTPAEEKIIKEAEHKGLTLVIEKYKKPYPGKDGQLVANYRFDDTDGWRVLNYWDISGVCWCPKYPGHWKVQNPREALAIACRLARGELAIAS